MLFSIFQRKLRRSEVVGDSHKVSQLSVRADTQTQAQWPLSLSPFCHLTGHLPEVLVLPRPVLLEGHPTLQFPWASRGQPAKQPDHCLV